MVQGKDEQEDQGENEEVDLDKDREVDDITVTLRKDSTAVQDPSRKAEPCSLSMACSLQCRMYILQ